MNDDHSKSKRDRRHAAVDSNPGYADPESDRRTGLLGTNDEGSIRAFSPGNAQLEGEYEDSNAPTRMTPVESVNPEVVIASSRIQSLEEAALPQEEKKAAQAQRPSQITVREKERHRGRLIITHGSNRTITYVESEPVTLGRDLDNDVELQDPKVSRQHLRIEQTLESFRLIDVSTSNGVRVNGQKVRSRELFDGALIQLGDTTIRFESLGWSKKPSNTGLDMNISGWAQVLTRLSRTDQTRLSVYAASLSFLTGGFIFLLMSFLAYPAQPSLDSQSLNYRRQAEKRALSGNLSGALDSLDKVTFLAGSLSASDLRRREKWIKRQAELKISRAIQVQTLADPLPSELDELMSQLLIDASMRADAAAQVSQSKLAHVRRMLNGTTPKGAQRAQAVKIYNEIDFKYVDRELYETVSRQLFPRQDEQSP